MSGRAGSVKCDAVNDVFFNHHLACYTQGPVSFCDMPLSDQARVVWHAKSMFFSRYIWETLKSGAEVFWKCGVHAVEVQLRRLDGGEPSPAALESFLGQHWGSEASVSLTAPHADVDYQREGAYLLLARHTGGSEMSPAEVRAALGAWLRSASGRGYVASVNGEDVSAGMQA